MRHLHKIIGILVLSVIMYACSSSPLKNGKVKKEEPVVIANDSLEYEVIIFDIGFTNYLNSIAKPLGYYTQSYLENWNRIYITTWNIRAQNPTQFDQNIYANIIDYDYNIDYGMDVNYKLFNYFVFAQRKYGIRLDAGSGPIPRLR